MINQATRTYQTFTRPPPLPDHIVINKTSELVELIDIPFSTLEKSVKYFVSVQNGDHPNSVAKVIMDDKKVFIIWYFRGKEIFLVKLNMCIPHIFRFKWELQWPMAIPCVLIFKKVCLNHK